MVFVISVRYATLLWTSSSPSFRILTARGVRGVRPNGQLCLEPRKYHFSFEGFHQEANVQVQVQLCELSPFDRITPNVPSSTSSGCESLRVPRETLSANKTEEFIANSGSRLAVLPLVVLWVGRIVRRAFNVHIILTTYNFRAVSNERKQELEEGTDFGQHHVESSGDKIVLSVVRLRKY